MTRHDALFRRSSVDVSSVHKAMPSNYSAQDLASGRKRIHLRKGLLPSVTACAARQIDIADLFVLKTCSPTSCSQPS